jgi:ribonuclease HI
MATNRRRFRSGSGLATNTGAGTMTTSLVLISLVQLALLCQRTSVLSFTLHDPRSVRLMSSRPHQGYNFGYNGQERYSKRSKKRLFLDASLSSSLDSSNNNNNDSNTSLVVGYTLQYSPNFQRHIVRRIDENTNSNTNSTVVVESFPWLDQALEKYPSATLLPLEWRLPYLSIDVEKSNSTATVTLSSSAAVPAQVAGGGCDDNNDDETTTNTRHIRYPVKCISISTVSEQAAHTACISAVLQAVLELAPAQVHQLLEAVPGLHAACPVQLQERLRFYLAPLPTDLQVLQQLNQDQPLSTTTTTTATVDHLDLDWPVLFQDGAGQGAGMSVAQVSHALKVVPLQLLRSLPPICCGADSSVLSDADAAAEMKFLIFLYEQTPSVVLEMALQQLDPWISTAVPRLQVAAAAYLHWTGQWEWTQWRVVLTALPGTVTPSEEIGWELLESGTSTAARAPAKLQGASLQYLQLRLQVGPASIHAILKTHLPLMRYSVEHIRRNLNDLQSLLCLSSADLQGIILIMPSLLGSSRRGLATRLSFWMDDVGLTVEQLRQVVKRQPAVLQYSVDENLRKKLEFFTRDLEIPITALAVRLTCIHPDIWGRSLDRHLVPMAVSFKEHANLSLPEFGQMVVQAPELLRCHFKNNLQIKLEFLRDRLGLEPDELKAMVLATPRILMQSVEYSLQPKIALLEEASNAGKKESQAVLRRNPSLLLNAHGVLKGRLERASSSVDVSENKDMTLSDLLNRSSAAKRARRTSKAVRLVPSENQAFVELEFANVAEAAIHACISTSNMYSVLRQGRLLQGKKYVYADVTTSPTTDDPDVLATRMTTTSTTTIQETKPEESLADTAPGIVFLRICAAGRAFPSETVVRGRRRAGGLALCVPTWNRNDWRKVCTDLWTGKRMRLLSDEQTMIVAYPYTRPSRQRCSLYACREALRAATQWLDYQEEAQEVEISIETDSNYVLDLLQNTTQVLEWGKATSKADFLYTGPAPLYQVNRDILYPLARTYYHLIQQDLALARTSTATKTATTTAQDGSRSRHNVTVRFVHSNRDPNNRQVGKVALHAARLTYDKIK